MIRRILLQVAMTIVVAITALPAFADKRIALVIGNSAYQNVSRLDNPRNDATLMATTLKGLGFTLIGDGPQLDLDKVSFDLAVQKFGSLLQGAEVGMFYYAGHGVQVRGSNYLIPISANPRREADVDFQMVDVNLVLRQMEGAGTKLNLVVLDACRNNPFGGRGLRATEGGLAQMRAPEGTLIAFATQPGNVALDGEGNSPYTKALAATVHRSGLDIFQTFNEVGLAVKRATGGSQQPWVSSSPIDGNFYFTSPSIKPSATGTPFQPDRPSEAERAWSVTKDTTSQAVLQDFIRQFGTTIYGSMARARLDELKISRVGVATPPPSTGTPVFADDAKLLGRFDDWAAYTATSKGSKVCFALARPKKTPANLARGPVYALVATRPADKVVNELSIITDYHVMPGSGPSTIEIGGDSYVMYGQNNGFWINNLSEQPRVVDTMRHSAEIAIRGRTVEGAQKNDVYSLKGFAQALDRAGQDCR
jgi:hypothetical protein